MTPAVGRYRNVAFAIFTGVLLLSSGLVVTAASAGSAASGYAISVNAPAFVQSTVGAVAGVSISATDSNSGSSLRYGASDLPAGMKINPSTGLISGTPTALVKNTVTVTAIDGTGAYGTARITWQVGGNITIDAPSGGLFFEGQTVNLPFMVNDNAPDDTLTYQVPSLPPGLHFDMADSLITGWPAAPENQSMAMITVSGLNGGNGSADLGFSISGPDLRAAGSVRLGLGGMCLNRTGGSQAGISACDGSAAQNWTYASDGTLEANGTCLDVTGQNTTAGTAVGVAACGASASQWVNATDGQLRELRSGYCLTDSGARLEITGCAGGGSRGWTLPAETVHSAAANRCLDDSQGGTANGTMVDVASCNGRDAQNWTFEPDGTIRVNGKCLDDSGTKDSIGSKVSIWTCDGSAAQQWAVTGGSDSLGLELRHGLLCASPGSMTPANSTQITLKLCGADETYWHSW